MTLKNSEANARSVLRQARLLVGGAGVAHRYNDAAPVFARGRKLTLGSNFTSLLDEAWEWENTYGEDYGHGWLLRHPIKKLMLFQEHVYLATKKATKSAAIL